MQPRRERDEDEEGETVFQVTKRGDSLMGAEERWAERRGWRPIGTKLLLEEAGVEADVEGEREEDDDAGVEVPEGKMR